MNLYCISFPNGKRYIGVESPGGNRWKKHCNPWRGTKLTFVASAIQKYGKDNCQFEYLAKDIDREWCLRLERAFIRMLDLMNPCLGYNLTEGGLGVLGIKHSEITKKTLSNKTKKLWDDSNYREKVTNASYGPKHTEAHKKAMSERLKGVPLSQEHCDAISEGLRGRVLSDESCEKISASKKLAYQNDPTLAARCTAACHTPEAWAKISAANKGSIHTDEHKQKIAAGLRHAYRSGKRMAVKNNWTPQQKIEISERLKLAYANGTRKSRKGIPRSHSLV